MPTSNLDDLFTPAYAVKPILEFIPEEVAVWCAFDTLDSEFVKVICEHRPVAYSHISFGQDFFEYEPDTWDILITKPTFSNKDKVIARALEFGKPFALMMPSTWIAGKTLKNLFVDATGEEEEEKEIQTLKFDRDIEYFDGEGNITTMKTAYCCYDLLPSASVKRKLNVPV
jgi:hypothetical protein